MIATKDNIDITQLGKHVVHLQICTVKKGRRTYGENKSSAFVGSVVGLDLYGEVAEPRFIPLEHRHLAVREALDAPHEAVEILDPLARHFQREQNVYLCYSSGYMLWL